MPLPPLDQFDGDKCAGIDANCIEFFKCISVRDVSDGSKCLWVIVVQEVCTKLVEDFGFLGSKKLLQEGGHTL